MFGFTHVEQLKYLPDILALLEINMNLPILLILSNPHAPPSDSPLPNHSCWVVHLASTLSSIDFLAINISSTYRMRTIRLPFLHMQKLSLLQQNLSDFINESKFRYHCQGASNLPIFWITSSFFHPPINTIWRKWLIHDSSSAYTTFGHNFTSRICIFVIMICFKCWFWSQISLL